jgi:hypothetical protein
MERAVREKVILAALVGICTAVAAHAAGETAGRFTMSPAEGGGFVRLDTLTGAMALCRPEKGDWSCKPMAGHDVNQRQELDRLTAENQALKAEVRRLEELLLPSDRGAGAKPPSGETEHAPGTLQLPSEQDVDRAFNYLEGILKRFRERMRDFDKDKGVPL